jgi:hypothetical protein
MPDDTPTRFAPDDPAPSRSPASRRADWRAETPGATGNRTVLATITLLALLIVAGVLIGIFVFWFGSKPEPRFVTVPFAEYKDAVWPANPWARQDAERLAGCFPNRFEDGFTAQEQQRFRDLLARLAVDQSDQSRRPLVLHITALSVVHDHTTYILPGDARPGDPAGWVAVEEVLDAFGKALAGGGKLLILDLAHPVADPFCGILRDDVSVRLHDLLEERQRAGNLPFPVLTSCGPRENSLPADAERSSGFAFYLAEGLRGAADGYLPGRSDTKVRDREVTVAELAAFLSGRVSRWARLVHDRRQSPRVYGPTDAGPVFRIRSSSPDPSGPPDPYPQWLSEGWEFRSGLRAAGAEHARPDPFARLTAALVRAEREWLGSGNAERTKHNWDGAMEAWRAAVPVSAELGRTADMFAKALGTVGHYRLTVARWGRPAPPEDWAPALDRYIATLAASGKSEEVARFREEWLKKVQPEKGCENQLDAASLIWDRSRLSPPTPERARALAVALDELQLKQEYSETLLLRSIAAWDYRRQGLSAYPQEQAAALLQAEDELSRLLALGPDGFELVRDRLENARSAYEEAQKDLFAGSFTAVGLAKDRLTGAATEFTAAREALARWQEGKRKLDAAVTVVLDTMPAALLDDKPGFDRWVEAVRATTSLADQIAPAGGDRTLNPAAIAAAVQRVDRSLPTIPDPFAPPPGKKEADPRPPSAKPSDLLPLMRLTAGTFLPAESRRKAWEAIRADTALFHESARQQDAIDDEARDQTTNPITAEEKGRVDEVRMAVRRARASVELLRLAGYSKAGELVPLIDALERSPEAAEVEPLGRRLRKAWAEDLVEQARGADTADRWHEADRIARVTPQGVTAVRGMERIPAANPRVAELAAQTYLKWVRDQLLADRKLRPRTNPADRFYQGIEDQNFGPD